MAPAHIERSPPFDYIGKKQKENNMKTLILIATLILSIQSFAAGTIKHETCNVVMAKGPYYGTFANYDMPKDYFDKFRQAFESKGYNVVDQMSIGTYHDHPYVHQNANDQKALAFFYRATYQIISGDLRGESSDDHLCRMNVELYKNNYRVISKEVTTSTEVTLFKNQYRKSICNKVFRNFKKSIPKCEIK